MSKGDQRKHVLLIGDSIRMGYEPLVRSRMQGVADVTGIPENGGDSRNVLTRLAAWFGAFPGVDFTVVAFNCGLHDIKRAFGSETRQVSLTEYAGNLPRIVSELRCRTDARLVWATTTPVLTDRHRATKGFDRFQDDVVAYNAVAESAMHDAGVEVLDLHEVICIGGVERLVGDDGVHMADAGNDALASAVVERLAALV